MIKASIECIGTGETEDDAITDLIFNLNETARRIEFETGGEDCVDIEECEDDED